MESILDPTEDVVFKTLFGKQGNEDLLEDLVGNIIGKKIKVLSVMRESRVGRIKKRWKVWFTRFKGNIWWWDRMWCRDASTVR